MTVNRISHVIRCQLSDKQLAFLKQLLCGPQTFGRYLEGFKYAKPQIGFKKAQHSAATLIKEKMVVANRQYSPRPVDGIVCELAVVRDGETVVSTYRHHDTKNILVWRLDTAEVLMSLRIDVSCGDSPARIALPPDESRAVVAGIVVDLTTAAAFRPHWNPLSHATSHAAIMPDGDSVLFSCDDGIFRGNVENGRTNNLAKHPPPHRDRRVGRPSISSLALTPDGCHLFSGTTSGRLAFWLMDRRGTLGLLDVANLGHCIHRLAVTPDGKCLVCATGSTVTFWDTITREKLPQQLEHETEVQSLCLTPSGNHVITGCCKGVVNVHEVATGMKVREFTTGGGGSVEVAMARDNILLTADDTVAIWHFPSCKPRLLELSASTRLNITDTFSLTENTEKALSQLPEELGRRKSP